MLDRRHFFALSSATALMPELAFDACAQAQTYPSRYVRLVVPFPPGGPTDIIARLYAQALGPVLKQTVLVENRAGGSGVTGTDYVLKSAADGYTFGIIDGGSLTILPHTQPKMPYRVPEDVTPISVVTRVPEALVAHPSLGVKSLPELLELAKRQPGRLNIGTAGAAGISHLTALVFRAQTGAAVEVVPGLEHYRIRIEAMLHDRSGSDGARRPTQWSHSPSARRN